MITHRFAAHPIAFNSVLHDAVREIVPKAWPEFMLHDAIGNRHWNELYRRFPQFQFAMVDEETGSVVGQGNSVPLSWAGDPSDLPEEGWDWAMEKSMQDHEAGHPTNIQCAIQIVIAPQFQNKGISRLMVQAMKAIGQRHGFRQLIAPVRPSLKSAYPLTDIDDYILWKTDEGLPFDPWLRVHARLGARIVKACRRAMDIHGSVASWESWSAMRFPITGQYVVPGALVPIDIDCEADLGRYIEPNVWMLHAIP